MRRAVRLGLLIVGCATVTSVAAIEAAGRSHARARLPQTTCFWTGEGSSKLGIGRNFAFPDTGAVYWSAQITMPPGSWIVFKGRFAHARYQSLNTYDLSTRAPIDALNDVSTKPDRGSTNPFRVGANRDAKRRSYTITMYNRTAPAHKAANTLYAGVGGQSGQTILYRVYLPEPFTRRDATGRMGLPVPTLHLADASAKTGTAACRALATQKPPLPLTTLPKGTYESLRDQSGKPPTFPAEKTPVFGAFYNTQFSIACGYYGQCSGHPARTGGQYSNIDNQYVAAFVNRAFGPVLVLRGKLPTTPRTGRLVKRMGTGQLRYWSMCQNESLHTTRGAGCLYDAQIPVDKRGYYTIVTSLRKDRPKNANLRCGVAWIPWPARGDGAGHLKDALLLVRNMLPAPTFHHAIQHTTTPGDEQAVLGPYYPRGTYTKKSAFQRRRCPALESGK